MSIEANKAWTIQAEEAGIPDGPALRAKVTENLQTLEAGLKTRRARFDTMSPQNEKEREKIEEEKAREIRYIETVQAHFLHPLMDKLGIPIQSEPQPATEEPALV